MSGPSQASMPSFALRAVAKVGPWKLPEPWTHKTRPPLLGKPQRARSSTTSTGPINKRSSHFLDKSRKCKCRNIGHSHLINGAVPEPLNKIECRRSACNVGQIMSLCIEQPRNRSGTLAAGKVPRLDSFSRVRNLPDSQPASNPLQRDPAKETHYAKKPTANEIRQSVFALRLLPLRASEPAITSEKALCLILSELQEHNLRDIDACERSQRSKPVFKIRRSLICAGKFL